REVKSNGLDYWVNSKTGCHRSRYSETYALFLWERNDTGLRVRRPVAPKPTHHLALCLLVSRPPAEVRCKQQFPKPPNTGDSIAPSSTDCSAAWDPAWSRALPMMIP